MSKTLYDKIKHVLELADGVIALQEKEQHWAVKGEVITSGWLRDEFKRVLEAMKYEEPALTQDILDKARQDLAAHELK